MDNETLQIIKYEVALNRDEGNLSIKLLSSQSFERLFECKQ